ncbi:hypothetical protein BUN20_18595 [Bacteroides fragilis]|uniref:Uncharacterized protein n=1 Tax=Bacteroides fragilis 3_1_12 TaxID=457424 RepID=A0ABN0BRB9_BACFG|nr:hypothetical protein BUN20_18595 [Bacteroides fragilis]EFR55441.1 hypothetical protein BFAG_04139 [Bacteroides fragilis 3_1_12]OCL16065.1 hypothetical protein AOQ65_18785 [Bacteroides fragilis]OCM99611.1 hypothetical protein AE749_05080 [Bacteroides fragilis]
MNLQMLQIVLVICSMKAFLQFVDVIIWGAFIPKECLDRINKGINSRYNILNKFSIWIVWR